MFPWDDPPTTRTTGGHTILDWKELGWDFENATSCHHLADPPQAPQKLWTASAKFVFDGTTCCICFNAFGPEGGFILGTCEHMYHPIYLIAHMVIWRRCCACKAPFYERLYELFGLCPYMPPSWEHNPENTPSMPSKWSQDLVWNWKMSAHILDKSAFSFAIGWENDHEEIVRVANSIVKGNSQTANGVRNFFYQCFKGYWDLDNQRFQFGTHPLGLIYNKAGQVVGVGGDAPLDVRNEVNIAESNWTSIFKEKAVDFLLEQHSPATMRVVRQMQSSQYMRDTLEIDGPARHTRAAVRRALNMNPANEAGTSNPRPRYEIPLPTDRTEEHRVVVVDDTDSD